jgi:hypothetical protein
LTKVTHLEISYLEKFCSITKSKLENNMYNIIIKF